jgi:hypothetical protein
MLEIKNASQATTHRKLNPIITFSQGYTCAFSLILKWIRKPTRHTFSPIKAKKDDDQNVDWSNSSCRKTKTNADILQQRITGTSAHEKIVGETFIFQT